MKTKIAFVTPGYLPINLSGSAVIVQNLAEELTRKGFDCSVITSSGLDTRFWYDPIFGKRINKKFETINGVKIYRLGCKHFFSFVALILVRFFKPIIPKLLFNKLQVFYCGPNLTGLTKLLEQKRFDIVYSSPLPAYLNKKITKIAEKITPKPKLILGACFHDLLSDYHNPEIGSFINKFDLIHVFFNREKEDIKKVFLTPEKKFAVIPPFLKLQTIKKGQNMQKEIIKFKNKHHLKKKKIILFAAGKIEMKGIYHLLKVIDRLCRKNYPLTLLTIGNSDLPQWKETIRQMKPNFLLDLGYVSQRQKEIVFAACDIYCMPSVCESFGLTYLEAWVRKKPTVGADIPAMKELIGKSSGGLLIEFGNERQLEKAIKKLIDHPKLAERLGESGYRATESTYSSQNLIHKYEKIFSLGQKNAQT